MMIVMHHRRSGFWRIIACLALTGLGAIGCTATPQASRGGFDSPDPAAKLYAIRRAAAQRDASAVPHLIQQLDSDDPAVRLFAITALQRITGTRHGYAYYDPPARRRRAIERWLSDYADGRIDGEPDADAAVSTRQP